MRFGAAPAVLAVILSLAAASARAENCPAKSTGMDDIIAAVNGATSCDRAKACGYASSGDVQFASAVEKKCEGGFLNRLKAPEKQTYQREIDGCDRKYQDEDGSMYRSFAAFCRAKVAQRYAQKASRQAGPSKARLLVP